MSLLREQKKRHENINEKPVMDNKLFWKPVTSLLFDKFVGIGKTHLIAHNEVVKTDLEIADVLNYFFFYMVDKNNIDKGISRSSNYNSLKINTNDITLKPTLKHGNHLRVIAI